MVCGAYGHRVEGHLRREVESLQAGCEKMRLHNVDVTQMASVDGQTLEVG